eukprot:gene7328-biopygen8640
MASRVENQSRGGKRCVAGGPNLVSCGNSQYTDGVSVHLFPDKEKDNARHQKWVQFVRRYRPGWVPSKTSILCGSHFEESSFTMRRDIALQLGVKSFLKPDAVPTVHVANEAPKISEEMSDRDRKQIVRSAIVTPKSIETTTSDIGDDVEEANDNKELDSRVESNIAYMDASSLSGYIMDSGSDDNGLDEVHVSQDLSLENEDEEDWATLEESADSTDTEDDGNQFVSRNLVRVTLHSM